MGQRSQIYIRNKENQIFIANYYQWNYGKAMVSRTRYGIEFLLKNIDYLEFRQDVLPDIFDVNFDTVNIEKHMDIVEYLTEHSNTEDFNLDLFDFENNDGKLLIDITNKKIKYCFLDCANNVDNILNAEEYMAWDNEEIDDVTRDNIEAINEMAELMTKDEVEEYLTYDYEGGIRQKDYDRIRYKL